MIYDRYPGLKPPSSPTPSPPQVLSTTSEVVEAPEVPSLIEEKVPEITKEVASSVKEAVEDTGFLSYTKPPTLISKF